VGDVPRPRLPGGHLAPRGRLFGGGLRSEGAPGGGLARTSGRRSLPGEAVPRCPGPRQTGAAAQRTLGEPAPSSGGLTVRIATQARGGQERRPPAGGQGSRIGALARGCHVVPFIRGVVAGCLALGLVGCATSSDGTRERTGL